MDFEIISARRQSTRHPEHHQHQRRHEQSNASRNRSGQSSLFQDDDQDVLAQFHQVSKKGFWGRLQSTKVRLCLLVIFTLIIMTIGILVVYFSLQKSGEQCQWLFRRTMPSSIALSSQPRSAATGDINHDNYIDVVVANSGTNTIGVFISNGNGTLADQQTYSTGSDSQPYSVTLSDINNDTYLDIAVANYATNNIGIFLGLGNGSFDQQNVISLESSRPLFVKTGDFNQDKHMDIVTVNNGTQTISILFGYGNGSFHDQVTYSTGYDSFPVSLAVGDLNNDKYPDIVVANSGTDNIGIFLNGGNGTFTNQQIYTTTLNSKPLSVALGDINNDEHLDIIVANYDSSNIGILYGYGNGSFLSQIIYSLGNSIYPRYVSVGDMDEDDALDIVIVDDINARIHVLPGYGNGSFSTITTYIGIVGSQPCSVALDDINNNNALDIVVVNYGTNNILLLNDYFQKLSQQGVNYAVGTPGVTGGVAVGDFNNDDILDMISYTDKALILLSRLDHGFFQSVPVYSFLSPVNIQYICAGDMNNDNQMDIIIADLISNSIGIVYGYGNGTFSSMASYVTGPDSSPYWVSVSDINNDNRTDMIVANAGTSSIGIFFGNDAGTLTGMMMCLTGDGTIPTSIGVGDINNDTHLDLIVTNWNSDVVTFLGYGNGTFMMWKTYTTDPYPGTLSIALADFNNDNYLDFVISNALANYLGVFLNYGNGTFTDQITVGIGFTSQPYYVSVNDLNNDNIADIAVTSFGNDQLVGFYGYGNGYFAFGVQYLIGDGSKPYGLVTADLDNDKQIEYIVALIGMGSIAVFNTYYAASFLTTRQYSTGSTSQPYSLAVGYFNDDNRPDIVVANSGTDNLEILIDYNDGTFEQKLNYSIGTNSYPQYVTTCDINRDNKTDIVSVNSKSNSISVIIGYGNGSFADQMVYSTGDQSSPYAVVAGDLNNDNRLDLVVSNPGASNIGVFYGYNYTSFPNYLNYSNIYSRQPNDIIAGDFNNDNILDIASTFNIGNGLGVLLGDGNGSFGNITFYSTGSDSKPWGIDARDLNNDKQTDIVVTITGTSTIGVLLGYGNGSFAPVITYSTGINSFPMAIAIGDYNNDSHFDIAVANQNDNNVGVLLGYGNGSFSTVKTFPTGDNSQPYFVANGDLNADGRLDIAVANSGNDTIGVLIGHGDGTFADQITFSTGDNSAPNWIAVYDFNNDNQLDIASANYEGNNVGILFGYGNGSFDEMTPYSTGIGSLPSCLGVGDFNNDNIIDIAVTNSGTDNVNVLFGVKDGSFLLGTPYSTGATSQPFALVTGDLNNDTLLDIAVANSRTDNIGILLAYGSQSFGTVTKYNIDDKSKPHLLAINDLNNDGWLDVVVANYGNDNIGILYGLGHGRLDQMMNYSTGEGSAPYAVGISDFNNDHHLDIVVTNSETDNIMILYGDGNKRFGNVSIYSTGSRSRPYTISISDFNNDNRTDIAVANSGTSNIYILYGDEDGTFVNGTSYPFGYEYSPSSIVATDLDNNNMMDMAIACYGTDHIETLLKKC